MTSITRAIQQQAGGANPKLDETSAGIVEAIHSRHPLLYVVSWEEERLVSVLQTISSQQYGDDRPVLQWTGTRGFYTDSGPVNEIREPLGALQHVLDGGEERIFLMKDLPALLEDDPALVRKLRDVYEELKHRDSFVVLSYPMVNIPDELKKEITLTELRLASADEIFNYLNNLASSGDWPKVPEEWLYRCALAMRGLSLNEVHHMFFRIVRDEIFEMDRALEAIYDEKGQILFKESCLKMVPMRLSLDQIGGLDRVKEWVRSRKLLFSKKAREAGIPFPSGVLFMGISGCGKSLAAKTIASAWGLQLVRLDMNLIMSGAFGSPEIAFERATHVAEQIAPLVVWIDEIENGFGYDEHSVTGGNVNIFGSFLTWMQEKPENVFLVATANRINRLPAEMIRKGRFDEVFFLDLPLEAERQEIFRIHIIANGGNPAQFNLASLGRLSKGWTGAEIEQAVRSAKVRAFTRGEEFHEAEVQQSISHTVPLSETMNEQINQLRKWSLNRATPASSRMRSG